MAVAVHTCREEKNYTVSLTVTNTEYIQMQVTLPIIRIILVVKFQSPTNVLIIIKINRQY